MGIVIPSLALFNMQIFKIHIPITLRSKFFPSYSLYYGYYWQVSVAMDFFDIPMANIAVE